MVFGRQWWFSFGSLPEPDLMFGVRWIFLTVEGLELSVIRCELWTMRDPTEGKEYRYLWDWFRFSPKRLLEPVGLVCMFRVRNTKIINDKEFSVKLHCHFAVGSSEVERMTVGDKGVEWSRRCHLQPQTICSFFPDEIMPHSTVYQSHQFYVDWSTSLLVASIVNSN